MSGPTAFSGAPHGGAEINDRDGAPVTTITLWGEIDMDVEPALERLRARAVEAARDVVLDTTAVTFIDSRALVFLAKLIRTLAPHRVKVPDPPTQVAYILQMTRMDTILDITHDRPDSD